jgi:hypothetical protein
VRDLESVMRLHEMKQLLNRVDGGWNAMRKNPRPALVRLNAYIDELEANQKKRRGPKSGEVSTNLQEG